MRQTHPAATIDGQSTAISQEINIQRSVTGAKRAEIHCRGFRKKAIRAFHVNKLALSTTRLMSVKTSFFFIHVDSY